MRILISSYHFPPSVGGLEHAAETLAFAFCRLGHEVAVATMTPNAEAEPRRPFCVLRRPSAAALLRAVRWSEVYLQNNISLGLAWPLLAVRRPWVVTHQGFLRRPDGHLTARDRIKRALLPFTRSVCISRALADDLPVPARVIPNPYRDTVFRRFEDVPRDTDLAFAGRLVGEKRLGLLLEALARLRGRGLRPSLLVLGDGPLRGELEAQSRELGLSQSVHFAGMYRGEALARQLNRAGILVVPSDREPFGIVALEGIACGCAVIGSDGGGLPEAIGPCGVTFANDDAEALAHAIEGLLAEPAACERYRAAAPAHLRGFTADAVAKAYIEVLEDCRHG